MQQKYPFVPWLEYLNTILHLNIPLTKDEIIINQTPEFITRLQKLLFASKRTLANYMLWTAVKNVMSTLPKKIKSIRLQFETAAVGITEQKERWSACVTKTHKYFGLVTGALYIRKYFNPEAKMKAVELIENIRKTFVNEILQENEWMDETTKQRAIQKAQAMSVHIGYPDQLLDDKILDNFYQKLKINDNILETNLLAQLFLKNFSVNRLRRPVNETEWIVIGMITASVNAFYIFNRNVIGFPAGILQDIFFSQDRPNYVNYGSIGYIIAHEITHGFDDQGREFDHIGNLVNWWTNESQQEFSKKALGIIRQYDSFIIPELHNITVDGDITVGENIADNGAVKTAYHSYISQHREEELPLPGLTYYTPRQMFWLSTANTWCSLDRPGYLLLGISSDLHSPTRFRVNGPLTNSDEFAKDFQCSIGSKMNPKVKYQLW